MLYNINLFTYIKVQETGDKIQLYDKEYRKYKAQINIKTSQNRLSNRFRPMISPNWSD